MVQFVKLMHHALHGIAVTSRRLMLELAGSVITLCTVAICLMSAANAQTEYSIAGNNPNLESEYRKELDKWMLRAYEGDREAQFKVGVLFTNDQFNQPDFEQAVYWYKQAAIQGHVLAQYNLGHQYLTGVGVASNIETAMEWWLKAAKNNHPLAQFNIGRAYYLGIGLPEDHTKSRKWFQMAAKNQEPKSIDILNQLGWTETGEPTPTPNNLSEQANPNTSDEALDNISTSQESSLAQAKSETELVSRITPASTAAEAAPIQERVEGQARIEGQAGVEGQARIEGQAGVETEPEIANQGAEAVIAAVSEPAQTNLETTAPTIEPTTEPAESEAVNTLAKPTKDPIGLYTNPNIRSVLITIINNKNDLEVLKIGDEWIRVSLKQGFPVWVHEDYIITSGDIGTITGSTVNARSVPIVTNGTIVGKLKKNESVEIIDKNVDWYRVTSPARFIAWVKKKDFNLLNHVNTSDTPTANNSLTSSNAPNQQTAIPDTKWRAVSTPQKTVESSVQNATNSSSLNNSNLNDNDWLYSHSSDSYTLQLASFSEPEKIAEFTARKKFTNNPDLYGFTAQGKKDVVWTYFLYGQYNDVELAKEARESIKQKRAWIRNFGKLQQNRCLAWKRQLPPPKELNKYCIN